ncbi:unnamed protein product [Calypogeia fissa]
MENQRDLDMGMPPGGSASTAKPVDLGMEKNAWDSYDTVFLNAKAGMDSVDKKMVQKVVYDMSKGSKYFNNEQRKEAEVLQRIQRMNARAASLTQAELAEHEKATDLKIVELEASRNLCHVWVHVDMDAFYAAVETLVNPSLAGKPMAVGGMSMICTANYEEEFHVARKFGVRAAMPGFIARKLCPNLIFVRPDFKKYAHYSDLSRQVFKEYDPDFVARSMDEAYLDISKVCQLRNMSGAEVAQELRSKVQSATGLTCSAGVGANRLLAKVCSDINKPNGQFVLGNERESVMAFVSSLPIRKVNGIGKVTERILKEVLGVSICGDLLKKRSHISALFSQISTDFFLAVGLGIGGSETPQKEPRKSLSNERTFAAISEEHQLFQKLEELVELLADDMQKEDLQGRTLTLKLKETGFEVRSRAVTLPSFISTKSEIWDHASKLLKGELPLSLRLMGLRMSNFKDETSNPTQRTLTSFITRSGSAKGDQITTASNALRSVPGGSSSSALDMPFEASFEEEEHYCGGGSHEKYPQEFAHDKKGQSGGEMLQAVIKNGSPQKDLSKSQQTLRNPIVQTTPPNVKTTAIIKSPGSVQANLEEIIARRQRDNFKESNAPTAAVQRINAQAGMRSSRGMHMNLEDVQRKGRSDGQLHSPNGEASVCQIFPQDDMSKGHRAMARKEIVKVLDPSLGEEDMHVPPRDFDQGAGQWRDLITSVETTEATWEALQSGYDSIHEKVWTDNQCALCGAEVNDCLPSARQEHEDFHFAMWLQQQDEESGGFQRSTTTTTRSIEKATRNVVDKESKRRKVSRAKGTSAHKRGSNRPIEAFFSKAK